MQCDEPLLREVAVGWCVHAYDARLKWGRLSTALNDIAVTSRRSATARRVVGVCTAQLFDASRSH